MNKFTLVLFYFSIVFLSLFNSYGFASSKVTSVSEYTQKLVNLRDYLRNAKAAANDASLILKQSLQQESMPPKLLQELRDQRIPLKNIANILDPVAKDSKALRENWFQASGQAL